MTTSVGHPSAQASSCCGKGIDFPLPPRCDVSGQPRTLAAEIIFSLAIGFFMGFLRVIRSLAYLRLVFDIAADDMRALRLSEHSREQYTLPLRAM